MTHQTHITRRSDRHQKRYPGSKSASNGFTLIEILAALTLITILLTGILIAYSRTLDSVAVQTLRERALSVGQRHMENLLSTLQEPNSVNLPTRDEIDPMFIWELSLKRVNISGQTSSDISETVIEATINVTPEDRLHGDNLDVKLVRYITDLTPIPGQKIAVPMKEGYMEEDWYLKLKEKLGRDPTPAEIFQEQFKDFDFPDDFFDDMDDMQMDNNENIQ